MRLLLALMWLLHWLPLPLIGRLGEAVGSLLYLAMGSRRRITLTNLRLCLPSLTERERRVVRSMHVAPSVRLSVPDARSLDLLDRAPAALRLRHRETLLADPVHCGIAGAAWGLHAAPTFMQTRRRRGKREVSRRWR